MLKRDSREYLLSVMRVWTLLLVLGLGLLVSASAVGYGRRITVAIESPSAIVDLVAISSAGAASPLFVCSVGEGQANYLVGARFFDSPVRIGMVWLAACTDVGGEQDLVVGPEIEVFRVGANYGSCDVSSVFGFTLEGQYAVAEVGCADSSSRIFEFEWDGATGGTYTEVVRTGDALGDGSLVADLGLGLDVRFDGIKLNLAFAYTDDSGREGIVLSEQGAPYTHTIAARVDLLGSIPRGVQLEYDCPEGSAVGDPSCPIPAPVGLVHGTSTTAFGSVLSLRDSSGPIAAAGTTAAGYAPETWTSFFNFNVSNFAAGTREGLFVGTTSGNQNGLWRYDSTQVELLMGTGDPLPDSTGSFVDAERPSLDLSGLSFMANADLVGEVEGNLRGLVRPGTDIVGGKNVLSLINGRRAISNGMVAMGISFGGSDQALAILPLSEITRIEKVTGGADAVYGADAVAGVVNVTLKNGFEGIEVTNFPQPPAVDLRSATFNPDGDLELGTLDGHIQVFDHDLHTFTDFDTETFAPLLALARDGQDRLWASNGATLYSIDTTSYLGSTVASLQDAQGGGIFNMRGFSYNEDTEELWGLRVGGDLGSLDTTTGVFTQLYTLDGLPAGVGFDSLALDVNGMIYAGLTDGRLVAASVMQATGGPIPDIPIDVHVDAGATLTGLAIMAPEPSGSVGLLLGALGVLGLSRRRLGEK